MAMYVCIALFSIPTFICFDKHDSNRDQSIGSAELSMFVLFPELKTCTVQYINFLYSMTTIISKFVSNVVNSFQIYLWRTTSCFNSCFIHEFLYTHEPMQFYFLFPGIENVYSTIHQFLMLNDYNDFEICIQCSQFVSNFSLANYILF